MALFSPENGGRSERTRRIWAAFELVYTIVDFGAALCFIVGSVMFFYAGWQTTGTWFFLVGSIMFAAKPSLRLAREIRLARLGDTKDLAKRFNG